MAVPFAEFLPFCVYAHDHSSAYCWSSEFLENLTDYPCIRGDRGVDDNAIQERYVDACSRRWPQNWSNVP